MVDWIFVAHVIGWFVIALAVMATLEKSRPNTPKVYIIVSGVTWPLTFIVVGMIMVIAIMCDIAKSIATRSHREP